MAEVPEKMQETLEEEKKGREQNESPKKSDQSKMDVMRFLAFLLAITSSLPGSDAKKPPSREKIYEDLLTLDITSEEAVKAMNNPNLLTQIFGQLPMILSLFRVEQDLIDSVSRSASQETQEEARTSNLAQNSFLAEAARQVTRDQRTCEVSQAQETMRVQTKSNKRSSGGMRGPTQNQH